MMTGRGRGGMRGMRGLMGGPMRGGFRGRGRGRGAPGENQQEATNNAVDSEN